MHFMYFDIKSLVDVVQTKSQIKDSTVSQINIERSERIEANNNEFDDI